MAVNRWDVWLANLDPVIGSEQGKVRPVLILSKTELNGILPVVNALPVTSRKPGRRIYPNEALLPKDAAGLPSESIVLCYQVRTLDKQRLIKRYGTLTDKTLRDQVIAALSFQLGVK
jgi:mRNA interferase MazF